MRDALAYEWVRIRTIRSTWWLTVLAFGLGVGLSLVLALVTSDEIGDSPSEAVLDGIGPFVVTQLSATGQVPSLVGYLLTIIGIFAWGHEYRHGMIRASLTGLRSRDALWAAKYAVVGAWVVVVQLVTMLVSALAGQLVLGRFENFFAGETLATMGWQLLSTLLLTWMAMAFTTLTRSQAFALVAIFLWPLLVETVIQVFFVIVPGLRDDTAILRFLPFSAQRRMTNVLDDATSTFGDPLSALGGTAVFGALALLLMAAAFALFRRRDA